MFRFDPVELPPQALALRVEVRDFIREHQHLMGINRSEFNRDFSRAMGRRGGIGMTWPKQYGGHERSAFERYVLIEEMLAAGAPLSAHYTGDRQSGPNFCVSAPRSRSSSFARNRGRGADILHWHERAELGFGCRRNADPSGEDRRGYRINGSKLWTSNAHRADYAICSARWAAAVMMRPPR